MTSSSDLIIKNKEDIKKAKNRLSNTPVNITYHIDQSLNSINDLPGQLYDLLSICKNRLLIETEDITDIHNFPIDPFLCYLHNAVQAFGFVVKDHFKRNHQTDRYYVSIEKVCPATLPDSFTSQFQEIKECNSEHRGPIGTDYSPFIEPYLVPHIKELEYWYITQSYFSPNRYCPVLKPVKNWVKNKFKAYQELKDYIKGSGEVFILTQNDMLYFSLLFFESAKMNYEYRYWRNSIHQAEVCYQVKNDFTNIYDVRRSLKRSKEQNIYFLSQDDISKKDIVMAFLNCLLSMLKKSPNRTPQLWFISYLYPFSSLFQGSLEQYHRIELAMKDDTCLYLLWMTKFTRDFAYPFIGLINYENCEKLGISRNVLGPLLQHRLIKRAKELDVPVVNDSWIGVFDYAAETTYLELSKFKAKYGNASMITHELYYYNYDRII